MKFPRDEGRKLYSPAMTIITKRKMQFQQDECKRHVRFPNVTDEKEKEDDIPEEQALGAFPFSNVA